MQLVILAGGLATRLGDLSASVPKSMIPVCGKPMLERQIELARPCGVDDIVVCIGHLGEQIRAYFGDGEKWGIRIRYSDEGETLLGTGGALKRAEPLLDSAFMMMWGDSYLMVDYADVWRTFQSSGRTALMVVYKNHHAGDRSNALAADGMVTLYDKWSGREDLVYIDYGLSVFRRSVLERIPADTVFAIENVFRDLASEGELAAYEARARFYEIGSPAGLRELESLLGADDAGANTDRMGQ
jgi:NDP-sugar pyrophosphorylase family protein